MNHDKCPALIRLNLEAPPERRFVFLMNGRITFCVGSFDDLFLTDI